MQILFTFILLLRLIATGWTAATLGLYEDPAYPGKCVFRGIVLAPAEVYNDPEKCEQIICKENGWTAYYSCGVFKVPNDCKLGGSIKPFAPYPDCCDHHILCNSI